MLWQKIDECLGCHKAKRAKYDLCLECHEGSSQPQRTSPVSDSDRKYWWYRREYSAKWEKGNVTTEQFYVYVLELDNRRFYAGHTNELRVRISEHRDDQVQSTKEQHPKLVWFDSVPTEETAISIEAELKRLINNNPREIRRMVLRFHDLTRELDFS